MGASTIPALLDAVLANDPARPLITLYDDATGERVELSAVTFDNWVAKTANLLADEGLEPGEHAAVLLPPHWQTAAIMLACWSAGLAVVHGGGPAQVAFAAADRLDDVRDADLVYGLSLLPLAAPLRVPPPGVSDYATEVRAHGDRFVPVMPVDPATPALVFSTGTRPPLSQAELVTTAAERAAELGLTAADRLLITDAPRPLDWLLAPLAAGASTVLCRNPAEEKLAARAASERVSATIGATVEGVRRLDP